MANIPAIWQIPVFLSQKPSTESGQFRVAVLRLAWWLQVLAIESMDLDKLVAAMETLGRALGATRGMRSGA